MNNSQNSIVMDLTKVCSTFPELGENNIQRDNMIFTVEELLVKNEVIIVEGGEGTGKTTLLAQFACKFPEQTFSLFMRPCSRSAYNAQMLIEDLCDQIGWVLHKEDYRKKDNGLEPNQLLQKRLSELQRSANSKRKIYYFVVDGLQDIPSEDCHEREVLLNILPFGLPRFRFILSGCSDFFQNCLKGVQIRPFLVSGFTLDETKQFFDGYVKNETNLNSIYKISKGIPGNLASMHRLLESGKRTEDSLLDDLAENLPKLFSMEWQVVEEKDNEVLRTALAVLAFDQRSHSLNTLSQLCKTDANDLKKKLDCCTFVEKRNSGNIEFVCDVFRRYAAERLSNIRKATLDIIISYLLNDAESADALTHLPSFYQLAGRNAELLEYLSPAHIGKLIECSESWLPLHQKSELGVNTALEQKRDGELLRFSLQRAIIASMENSEPWRSEVEAHVAVGDFSTAYALVQQVATKADRLHLLAVIARMKKTKSLPIELELKEQIQQLYTQLDRSSLGDRGVEIASDLLYTQPELAIELVQDCIGDGDSAREGRLDLALAHLSFKTFIEKEEGDGMESVQQAFRSKIKNPNVQKFMDTINLFFGDYTAQGVIAEVDKWEKTADRIYALRAWTVTNAKQKDAALVIDYAINTILQTTAYTANAKVYQELVSPLVHIPDIEQVKAIIGRLDGLREPIKTAGPTLEYVKLQAILAEAESRYDHKIASDRLLELYFYVDELTEPGTKLATLAFLAHVLKKIDADKQPEFYSGLHDSVVSDLELVIDDVLAKTAEHYEAVRAAIGVLARSDSKIALDVIAKLNTSERREAALVKFIESVATESPSNDNFTVLEEAYNKIKTIPMRARATLAALNGLSSQKKALASFLSKLYPFKSWICEIPDAEEKCQALCVFLVLLFECEDSVSDTLLTCLQQELHQTWKTIDSSWSKIDAGFKITARMADCFPNTSREFLTQTEEARKEIILDCPGTADTYFLSVQLTIRSFVGLLKGKLNKAEDLYDLKELIDKIPSAHFRVIAWSELALRFFLAKDIEHCKKIVNEQINPLLDPEQISDQEALWEAIVYAAPALHCAHSTSAIQLIEHSLASSCRDDAYSEICSFLISKRLPMESYDSVSNSENKVSYSDFLDICNLIERMKNDSAICGHIESCVDSIHKRFHNDFNNAQQADILKRLREFAVTKFPSPDGIQHEGYKILVEAQIERLDRQNNHWNDLKTRASAIPNLADKAFVLMKVAAAMPSKQKTVVIQLMQDAKALIHDIPFFEDRYSHYETLARLSVDTDKKFSKDCLRQAWNETNPLSAAELPKARQRIIDFAHRLDPEFASTLASETDTDPGRDFARVQVKQRLSTLTLRQQAADAKKTALSNLTQDRRQKIEIAKMLLSSLNSGRGHAKHIEDTRQDVKEASYMDLQRSYVIFSWAIENAVRRYANTDQATTILRPLYDAVRLSSELAFRIASRIRSVTDQGIEIARREESSSENGLILPGDREKALQILKEWASKATGFIKITDPYFGLEELELIKLIRDENPEIEISILTSRKQQKEIQQPWDESYRSHWSFKVSDADSGYVQIVVIGKGSSGGHPIHDRWWLSEKSGLRLGISTNGLGLRLSEISKISEGDLPSMIKEVDKLILGRVRMIENEHLNHSSFYL